MASRIAALTILLSHSTAYLIAGAVVVRTLAQDSRAMSKKLVYPPLASCPNPLARGDNSGSTPSALSDLKALSGGPL